MLLNILLVFHIIVCILLIVTVLMQQSEGGALGMGGGPSGFMTARGAGNLLTRITWILFSLFLLLSIGLTVLAGHERASQQLGARGIERLDPTKLAPQPAPTAPPADAPLTAPTPGLSLPAAPATAPAETAPQQ
jgi:preprotein translocase subunit SecG